MRTYYSFQVSKSSDSTYNLNVIGFWALAELTVGIIVGCLPVMPKLVHHIGAKISRIFSSISRDGVSVAPGLINRNEPPKPNAFTKIHRPFANHVGSNILESSSDTYYSPQARLHGEYLTSDRSDSLSLSAITTHEPTHPPSVVIATRRDDLEYGEKMI